MNLDNLLGLSDTADISAISVQILVHNRQADAIVWRTGYPPSVLNSGYIADLSWPALIMSGS